jgi:hypothetical protein
MNEISYASEKIEPLGEGFVSELTFYEGMIGGIRHAGRYCVIWKRVGGRLKLHHDTFNAAPIA